MLNVNERRHGVHRRPRFPQQALHAHYRKAQQPLLYQKRNNWVSDQVTKPMGLEEDVKERQTQRYILLPRASFFLSSLPLFSLFSLSLDSARGKITRSKIVRERIHKRGATEKRDTRCNEQNEKAKSRWRRRVLACIRSSS